MCINQIGVYFIYRLQIDFKVYNIVLRRRWAWHRIFEVNNICAWYLANIMPSLMFLALIIAELCVIIQTEKDINVSIALASHAKHEHMYSARSATLSAVCYIHLHRVNIPVSTVVGYKKCRSQMKLTLPALSKICIFR